VKIEIMARKQNRATMQWRSMDLHIHTPASSDYQQPEVTYLDVLKRAETRGLDMIAFTDHNSVAGYRHMQEEIEQLEMLKRLKRILPEEQARLDEYQRLLKKILVFPGIEFTGTFGFHVLGIFPPEKPVREIEHMLLELHIPADQLDLGSAIVGAASDVLTAYRVIANGGGLVIAAHANSTNGVAMRGFPIGGQTKIAYTQDANLHALEVTDLDRKGSGSTAAFFSGTKPEYPRRMHCIQGSDAHRLTTDTQRKKNLGIGDRASEVLVEEVSFEALKSLFLGNDFARTRPRRQAAEPAFDFVRSAREEGANILQDFHEIMTVRGGKRYAILADICAFANTNGGTLYVGLSADSKEPVVGIPDPKNATTQLQKDIDDRIMPPLQCTLDVQETGGKKVLRVLIPRGDDPPYALDEYKIYIRSESETGLAVRDEIVGLVMRSARGVSQVPEFSEKVVQAPESTPFLGEAEEFCVDELPVEELEVPSPRTGVEVVCVEERGGGRIFTLRDLRNNNVVSNVTRSSARRLWHYAITSFNSLPDDLTQAEIAWQGKLGILRSYKQKDKPRFDLVQRQDDAIRTYFGVTEDGIHGPWRELVGLSGGPEDE
jgi:hypothetical protein